jgi:hypothetical protein
MKHAWERKNAYKVLLGKPEGKRSLGRKDERVWSELIWLRIGTIDGLL